jgi:hypothetical protein
MEKLLENMRGASMYSERMTLQPYEVSALISHIDSQSREIERLRGKRNAWRKKFKNLNWRMEGLEK